MDDLKGIHMISEISSNSNPVIKYACSLSRAKARAEHGQHFIEGEKLVREAGESGIRLTHVFAEDRSVAALYEERCEHVFTVPRHVMEKMCESRTPQHICAIADTPKQKEQGSFEGSGFVVALDAVQDPGNVGTIIRSADAFGAACVLLGQGCADPFSGKVLRASMGSVYHLPILQTADLHRSLSESREEGFQLICGHLKGTTDLKLRSDRAVIVIGNEGNGVSDRVAELCDLYRIPMKGKAESLNASAAASILIYIFAKEIGS
ncbi:MAG: RNA methyltransferase [Clostridia bacterium]|nr:RNA methyltransferase [Clostridia bacterium]